MGVRTPNMEQICADLIKSHLKKHSKYEFPVRQFDGTPLHGHLVTISYSYTKQYDVVTGIHTTNFAYFIRVTQLLSNCTEGRFGKETSAQFSSVEACLRFIRDNLLKPKNWVTLDNEFSVYVGDLGTDGHDHAAFHDYFRTSAST